MAMPMKTAGTPTSSVHRTRLRRCSRIAARNTAVTREWTEVGRVALVLGVVATDRMGAGAIWETEGGMTVWASRLVTGTGLMAVSAPEARGAGAGRIMTANRTTASVDRPAAQMNDHPTSPRGPA